LRRISRIQLGAAGSAVVLAGSLFAAFVGFAPAGAASSTPKAAPAVTSTPKAGTNPLAPLLALPISINLPITLLNNVLAGSLLPGQDSTSGTNTTTQTSPLANVSAPVNVCSVSAGILANATSSCSTTSVGIKQLGAIANVNVPITAQDNAIGLLGQASTALGLNTTEEPASTTQNGAINASVPVTVCAVNVGLAGNTSSACNNTGSNGVTDQTGVIDAAVPVSVCDVIVSIAGNSTATCPQNPDSVSQHGELADLYVPAGICGVIAEIDGTATGHCMPVSSFPLVGGLPVNPVSQSAPIDGVLPINACSILVAIDGSATNDCEPAHLAPTQTGMAPVKVPVTVCSATVAVQGSAVGTCTGSATGAVPGVSGTGVTLPITICGIEGALGGTASANCPEPTTSPATTPGTPQTTVPATLASTTPVKTAAPAPAGALAFTGAPLVLELAIALMALLSGLAISVLARRQRRTAPRHAASQQ
jgi:hypothetical protein